MAVVADLAVPDELHGGHQDATELLFPDHNLDHRFSNPAAPFAAEPGECVCQHCYDAVGANAYLPGRSI